MEWKVVVTERCVLTLSRDGWFLMMVHELETLRREKIAIVNLVWRDGRLGSIRWKQMNKFGRIFGVDFGNPDLLELAKAFGIRGYRAKKAGDRSPILEEALNRNVPSLVDIPVDYRDNPFVIKEMGRLVACR
jgi:acetolactate synthase-1/2/3 large subunit